MACNQVPILNADDFFACKHDSYKLCPSPRCYCPRRVRYKVLEVFHLFRVFLIKIWIRDIVHSLYPHFGHGLFLLLARHSRIYSARQGLQYFWPGTDSARLHFEQMPLRTSLGFISVGPSVMIAMFLC